MTQVIAPKLAQDGSAPEDPDVAKTLVIAELARVAEEGGGVMIALESGTLEQ